jgi:hypothetical protein
VIIKYTRNSRKMKRRLQLQKTATAHELARSAQSTGTENCDGDLSNVSGLADGLRGSTASLFSPSEIQKEHSIALPPQMRPAGVQCFILSADAQQIFTGQSNSAAHRFVASSDNHLLLVKVFSSHSHESSAAGLTARSAVGGDFLSSELSLIAHPRAQGDHDSSSLCWATLTAEYDLRSGRKEYDRQRPRTDADRAASICLRTPKCFAATKSKCEMRLGTSFSSPASECLIYFTEPLSHFLPLASSSSSALTTASTTTAPTTSLELLSGLDSKSLHDSFRHVAHSAVPFFGAVDCCFSQKTDESESESHSEPARANVVSLIVPAIAVELATQDFSSKHQAPPQQIRNTRKESLQHAAAAARTVAAGDSLMISAADARIRITGTPPQPRAVRSSRGEMSTPGGAIIVDVDGCDDDNDDGGTIVDVVHDCDDSGDDDDVIDILMQPHLLSMISDVTRARTSVQPDRVVSVTAKSAPEVVQSAAAFTRIECRMVHFVSTTAVALFLASAPGESATPPVVVAPVDVVYVAVASRSRRSRQLLVSNDDGQSRSIGGGGSGAASHLLSKLIKGSPGVGVIDAEAIAVTTNLTGCTGIGFDENRKRGRLQQRNLLLKSNSADVRKRERELDNCVLPSTTRFQWPAQQGARSLRYQDVVGSSAVEMETVAHMAKVAKLEQRQGRQHQTRSGPQALADQKQVKKDVVDDEDPYGLMFDERQFE